MQIAFQLPLAVQRLGETPNGIVGNGYQVGEMHVEIARQIPMELLLHGSLVGRHGCPGGIEDERNGMSISLSVVIAKANIVQHAQCLNRGHKGTITANLIDVACAIEWKRAEQLSPHLGIQIHEVRVARVGENAQVRSHNGPNATRLPFAQEPFHIRMHFGSATRNIHRRESTHIVGIEARLHHLAAHDLGALGAALQMAMPARKVAHIANVNLQCGKGVIRHAMFGRHHREKRWRRITQYRKNALL